MKRIRATLMNDALQQFRNGFYYATAFVALIDALLVSQVPGSQLRWLLPAVVNNNLVVVTFYFVAGLVLLERTEGSLQARVVTPLRAGEYLASKTATLAALSLAPNLLAVGIATGWSFAALPMVAGMLLASALLVLFGFAAVARYASIGEFLLPSVGYVMVLMLPLVYAAGWDHWLLYLHPLQAPLVLLRAGVEPAAPWQVLYGLGYGGLWLWLAARIALARFNHLLDAE